MIYVEMYGRLGNQFFRYAFARYLQLKKFPEDALCINFNQIHQKNKEDKSWENILDNFKVAEYEKYKHKGKVIYKETNLFQKIVCFFYYFNLKRIKPEDINATLKVEENFHNILNYMGVYWFRYGFYPVYITKFKNKFVSGSFENPKYFDEIQEILKDEFTPIYDPLKKNYKLYDRIKSSNSVCVSIRRGDFVSDEKIKQTHYVCNLDYYYKAIEIMKRKLKKPVFFMFSDDIEWVKNNINIDKKYEVWYEDGTDPVWEKLRLMYSCKHFILSNSSFSWWVQYLSRNDKKIVISPDRWYNNGYISELIQEDFIKIST